MVYTRRKVGRRTYRRRNRGPKRTYRRAYAQRGRRSPFSPELKKVDLGQSDYSAGTTAGVIHVNAITQGDDYNQREGSKVVIRYVNARGWIKHNNTATDGQVVRVWLILDRQQVADSSPTAANIFTTAANSVTSPLNPSTVGRFRILWSKTYTVDPSNEIRPVFMGKKLFVASRFNGTANTDIQKNGLYIVYASSDNTNKPTLTLDVRTSYNDN